jgi:alpha-glucosidase
LSAVRAVADRGSVFQLYRRLIAERRKSPALGTGEWEELASPPEVLAYARRSGEDTRVVAINFAGDVRRLDLAGDWQILVSSEDGAAGDQFTGDLLAEQALLLAPRAK